MAVANALYTLRPETHAADPLIGQVLGGRYGVEARIGEGAAGVLYRARHHGTGGVVALKVLRSEHTSDVRARRRFEIEARNTHQLHHPNTVRLFDVGRLADDTPFLVLEHLHGRPLTKILEAGPLAPGRAVHIATQILRSLGEAHRLGIVHRKLEPDSVMLLEVFGEPDHAKVIDFGLSRLQETEGAQTQSIVGSPRYMAPEQCRGRKVDGRADLYSLGCMLYQMLTGRLPYDVSRSELPPPVCWLAAHIDDAPLPIDRATRERCPAELLDLTLSLLAKRPGKRARDAADVLRRLGAISRQHDLRPDNDGPIDESQLHTVHLPPDTALRVARALTPVPRTPTAPRPAVEVTSPVATRGPRLWPWALLAWSVALAGAVATWVMLA